MRVCTWHNLCVAVPTASHPNGPAPTAQPDDSFSSGNAVRRSISLKEDVVLSSCVDLALFFLGRPLCPAVSFIRRLFVHSMAGQSSSTLMKMKLATSSLMLVVLFLLPSAPASSAFSEESLKDLSRLPHLQRHWLQRLDQVNSKRNRVTTSPPSVSASTTTDATEESLEVIKNLETKKKSPFFKFYCGRL